MILSFLTTIQPHPTSNLVRQSIARSFLKFHPRSTIEPEAPADFLPVKSANASGSSVIRKIPSVHAENNSSRRNFTFFRPKPRHCQYVEGSTLCRGVRNSRTIQARWLCQTGLIAKRPRSHQISDSELQGTLSV